MSLQYSSRSSLHRLAGLRCLFLSCDLHVVTREVYRSSLRRLTCSAQDHFIFLRLLIISDFCPLPDPDVGLSVLVKKLRDVEHLGTFMYKLKYNKLPSAIPHMFVTNENIHSHNTRNKNGYLIPNVRTNCRKVTVSYAGPILWNSFPQKLRQLPSEVLFKRKLKYILLATY